MFIRMFVILNLLLGQFPSQALQLREVARGADLRRELLTQSSDGG